MVGTAARARLIDRGKDTRTFIHGDVEWKCGGCDDNVAPIYIKRDTILNRIPFLLGSLSNLTCGKLD